MISERVRQLRLEQQHYVMKHARNRKLTLVEAINDLNLGDDPIYRSFDRRMRSKTGDVRRDTPVSAQLTSHVSACTALHALAAEVLRL